MTPFEKMKALDVFVKKNKTVWSAQGTTLKAAATEATGECGFKVSVGNVSAAMKANGILRKTKQEREVDHLQAKIDAQEEIIKELCLNASIPDADLRKYLELPNLSDAVKEVLRRQMA